MRLFLAIDLDEALRDSLFTTAAPMRVTEPALAWIAAAKLHLTLNFLGETEEARVETLTGALDAVAARHRPFEMRLHGVGAFPNFRRARVVWCGVESEPRLELLHHDLELVAHECGFELEGRAFRPHVTLARVRHPMNDERGRALRRVARTVEFSGAQHVAHLTLYESLLEPTGARYRRLHAATFDGR
jgi:2'-5' RNA ligase